MTPQGMVHALDEIHRLLKPGGCLIDIHPFAEAPLYKVRKGMKILFSQPKPDFNPDDYLCADHTLAGAVAEGKYTLERSGEFEYIIHAASTAELIEYYRAIDAYDITPEANEITPLEAQFLNQIDEIIKSAGAGAEITTHEWVHIARMVPIK